MKHSPAGPPRPDDMAVRLRARLDGKLPEEVVSRLEAHARELARWGESASLIGRGTWGSAVERHYEESLEGLSLLPEGVRTLVDIGSGAGFPGFVLAAALPGARATLVDSRGRKVAFLKAAARRAGMTIECRSDRVEVPLPTGLPARIDLLTLRALRLPPAVWVALIDRLSPGGRLLLWCGADVPELPSTVSPAGEKRLPASDQRRIVAFERVSGDLV